jgi:hypothetical protein
MSPSIDSASHDVSEFLKRRSLVMRPRLFVYLGLALIAVSASVMVSQRVLAQAGQPPQGQRSQDDQNRQKGQFSEEIDKALQSYDERMDRNLEQCRKELDQMKKELHELIDMRINLAMSLYELRAKMHVHSQGAMTGGPGAVFASRGYAGVESGGRSQGSQGNDSKHGHSSELVSELQQLHNQLRTELDQQQNQVAQLAAQLRALRYQDQNQGQQGNSQGQHQGDQNRSQRGDQGSQHGSQPQPGRPSGQPSSNQR